MSPFQHQSGRGESSGRPPYEFTTTRWSVVLSARENASPQAVQALEYLCAAYWRPLWEAARRLRYKPEEADDVVQGFFADLLERHGVSAADPARGRFRTFLLTCFQNYLRNVEKHAHCAKRGGTAIPISLDALAENAVEIPEPSPNAPLEHIFDLKWAATVVQRALKEVRQDYAASGRGELFNALSPLIWGGRLVPLSQIAVALRLNTNAVKVAVHRLRERFRAALLAEVAQTLQESMDVEEELRYLMAVLSRDQFFDTL